MMANLLRKAQILHARDLESEPATNSMAQLKCDRQHPSCHRCTNRLVACNYPVPQDHKQIGTRRRALMYWR
ncbi:hypothetical protein HBH72_061790 [Parastagonospora nodorum]|nr:hypothetical protein HBH72_061790 [Parastagonospora nodorum]